MYDAIGERIARPDPTEMERACERASETMRRRGGAGREEIEALRGKESRGGSERDGTSVMLFAITYSPPRKRNKEIDRPSRGERRPRL